MKRITLIMLICLVSLGLLGCENTADEVQREETRKALKEAHAQIGMPAIKNFQERKLAKMIFELRDRENLTTYTYIINLQGKLILLGKSIGYGLPYSVQYTSPMKTEYNDGTDSPMPQADPNGLFMPEGLSATWVMLIDEKTGEPRPVYVEQEIVVSPFPLK